MDELWVYVLSTESMFLWGEIMYILGLKLILFNSIQEAQFIKSLILFTNVGEKYNMK